MPAKFLAAWPRVTAGDRDADKRAQRQHAALEAVAGLPTDGLIRIAALPPTERPAALAELAGKRAR
jgi:hypothetical protein